LLDVHTAFSEGSVGLSSCGYLHNMQYDETEPVFASGFAPLLTRFPSFAGDQSDQLADYLVGHLAGGDGGPILDEVQKGKYRPHKRLLEHTARMIRREPAYTLLDEQQVAFNHILGRVRDRQRSSEQTAFLIRGGPGTGKSVIAVNLLAELSAEGFVAKHATGSKAFTGNLRKAVGSRAAVQFGYFNGFMDADEQVFDALICDESHRIRETSANRFTPKAQRASSPQVEELMRAAKVSVFFIDDLQVVRPGEVGSSQLIRDTASQLGIPVIDHELEAQFRCGGSEAFVGWVESTLELRQTPYVLWDPNEEFDFDIVTPHGTGSTRSSEGCRGLPARLSAGFAGVGQATARWDAGIRRGIGDWSMPWNAKDSAGRLAKDIPKSDYWANDPSGINQVGCVYTAQGVEYEFAGVIFGRDLVWRPRKGWIGQPTAWPFRFDL
jgi:hypothetical protein